MKMENTSSDQPELRQQYVQTDELELGTIDALIRRLPTNFSHILPISLPFPPQLLNTPRKPRIFSTLARKSKLFLALETKTDGQLIGNPCVSVDSGQKQVKLVRPNMSGKSPEENSTSLQHPAISTAPKCFTVDKTFIEESENSKTELCVASLCDQILTVVNGFDSCLVYFNHFGNHKKSWLIGSDCSSTELGVVPSAISWLFQTISEFQDQYKFNVAVSAAEVYSSSPDTSFDLLLDLKQTINASASSNQHQLKWKTSDTDDEDDDGMDAEEATIRTEVVASSVTEAAYYLDVALAASRRLHEVRIDQSASHFFFTLHIYKHHVGGPPVLNNPEHSQLHLIELMILPEVNSKDPMNTGCLSSLLLPIINGQCNFSFPHRETKLTSLLSTCFSADVAKLCMILHTSVHSQFYESALKLFQLATKIQHAWKRRATSMILRLSHRRQNSAGNRSISGQPSSGLLTNCRLHHKLHRRRLAKLNLGGSSSRFIHNYDDVPDSSTSDLEYTSSSEQSCTTVIYLGRSHPLRKANATRTLLNLSMTTSNNNSISSNFLPKSTTSEITTGVLTSADTANSSAAHTAQPASSALRSPLIYPGIGRKMKQRNKQLHQPHHSSAGMELWVDGPKAMANSTIGDFKEIKTEDISQERTFGSRSQEIGVPDGKEFESREHRDRKLGTRIKRMNRQETGGPHTTHAFQQLDPNLTPRTQRKLRRGCNDGTDVDATGSFEILSGSGIRSKICDLNRQQSLQHQKSEMSSCFTRTCQSIQTLVTHTAPLDGLGGDGGSFGGREGLVDGGGMSQHWRLEGGIVKPFVKEWLEHQTLHQQNNTQNTRGEKPTDKISQQTTRNAIRLESFPRHVFSKTLETPQFSRKHRNISHDTKKRREISGDIQSRSLPRHANTNANWHNQSGDDSLHRVAQWVESVTTESNDVQPTLCLKHAHRRTSTCRCYTPGSKKRNPYPFQHGYGNIPIQQKKSDYRDNLCAKRRGSLNTSSGSNSRGSSAPAARFKTLYGPLVFRSIEIQGMTNEYVNTFHLDIRKPDGASDPGIHRDSSFNSHLNELETCMSPRKTHPPIVQHQNQLQNVPLFSPPNRCESKPTKLQRFADFFGTSTDHRFAANRGTRISKMCAPFFGKSPRLKDNDLLSVNSAGMLFTSFTREDNCSLFCEQNIACQPQSLENGSQLTMNDIEGCEKTDAPKIKNKPKESASKHRFGFLQSPLFSKRQVCVSADLVNTSSEHVAQLTPTLSYKQSRGGDGGHPPDPANGAQHNIVMHCHMKLENTEDKLISPGSLPKCVSQSSSSGLGSEHSGGGLTEHPPSVRCHCSGGIAGQHSGRMRRCRLRAYHHHLHRTIRPEVLNLPEGRIVGSNEGDSVCSPATTCAGTTPDMTEPILVCCGKRVAGSGGHTSSGYESILRDSEVSESASEGSMCGAQCRLTSTTLPVSIQTGLQASDAACQTSPFLVDGRNDISFTLTGSFTETAVSTSQNGEKEITNMNISISSRNSGDRTLSISTSKRSLSAPACSENTSEESVSSLPSVLRVSPVNILRASPPSPPSNSNSGLQHSLQSPSFSNSAPTVHVSTPDLIRANSDVTQTTINALRDEQINWLLYRQEVLKAELTTAKNRLLADPTSWSFDLNVLEHMNPDDEHFLEALENETDVLQQRVDACKSQSQYITYFQPPPDFNA